MIRDNVWTFLEEGPGKRELIHDRKKRLLLLLFSPFPMPSFITLEAQAVSLPRNPCDSNDWLLKCYEDPNGRLGPK